MTFPQEPSAKDWCAYHNTVEPMIDGAPMCGECWHQYQSDQDLLDQHNAWPGVRQLTSADEVFSCPLCCHDF